MSFKCAFCRKAQGKGKCPTMLLTKLHEVSQYDAKGRLLGNTLEIGGEKPACEACVATPSGQENMALRSTLGKVLTKETIPTEEFESFYENEEPGEMRKPEVFRGDDGKWGFRYWHSKDQDWMEDYGFSTQIEAELALGAELEDLLIECEGEVL